MEAESVEYKGEGILFCVYCYNNQLGITIDYASGESQSSGTVISDDTSKETNNGEHEKVERTYILNTSTKKFHRPNCAFTKKINDKNKGEYTGSRDNLIAQGYEPVKTVILTARNE